MIEFYRAVCVNTEDSMLINVLWNVDTLCVCDEAIFVFVTDHRKLYRHFIAVTKIQLTYYHVPHLLLYVSINMPYKFQTTTELRSSDFSLFFHIMKCHVSLLLSTLEFDLGSSLSFWLTDERTILLHQKVQPDSLIWQLSSNQIYSLFLAVHQFDKKKSGKK